MREWIRQWLGLDMIDQHLQDNVRWHRSHQHCFEALQKSINTITPGLGRVIAKLDPNYAKDDFDPEKRAESDRIALETIHRLKGEAMARKHMEGE